MQEKENKNPSWVFLLGQNMKMFDLIIIIAVAVLALIYLFLKVEILFSPTTIQNEENKVCFNSVCFNVELAKSVSEIENGLMFRDKLEENKGMLFVFDKEGFFSFWMKNTYIPLDIIWIKKNLSANTGQIVFIEKNIQPCKNLICPSFTPNKKANYVLEINAGLADKYNIKPGDTAEFIFKN